MHICRAAQVLLPGTAWNWDGKTLEQAIDGSPRVKVPTMDQLQPIMDSDVYSIQRAAAYPSINDQLDALWKGGADAQAMSDQIKTIKAKFPKPAPATPPAGQ